MRQSEAASADTGLKDSKSEPDCTRPVLTSAPSAVPCPAAVPESPSATACQPHGFSAARKHMLSRSQVRNFVYYTIFVNITYRFPEFWRLKTEFTVNFQFLVQSDFLINFDAL